MNANTQPDGFAAPECLVMPAGGHRPGQPCCGVFAVAAAAGVSFDAAWAFMSAGKTSRWKGRTYDGERIAALQHFGVRFTTLRLYCRMTLATFTRRFARPGALYMVHTGGHVQMVSGTMMMDQCGVRSALDGWASRKIVDAVLRIEGRGDA